MTTEEAEKLLLASTLREQLQGSDAADAVDILCSGVFPRNERPFNPDRLRDLDFSLLGDGAPGEEGSSPPVPPPLLTRLETVMRKCEGDAISGLQTFFDFLGETEWGQFDKLEYCFNLRIRQRNPDKDKKLSIHEKEDCPRVLSQVRNLDVESIDLALHSMTKGISPIWLGFAKDALKTAGECHAIIRRLRDAPAVFRLCESLSETTDELRQRGDGINYVQGLVRVYPHTVDEDLLLGGGKRSTLVIGGESGSGKSWHAAFGVARDVPRLYVEIKSSDLGQDGRERKGPEKRQDSERNKILAEKVRTFANDLLPTSDGDPKLAVAKDALHRSCTSLHQNRNEWIKDFMDWKIKDLQNDGANWFLGPASEHPELEHFILVVDEVGRDKDLLHGLIDYGRRYMKEKLNGKAKRFGMILAGTSLDDLYRTNHDEPLAGSNPEDSQVVVMQQADLGTLVKAVQPKYMSESGVMAGLYSGPFSTLVRIQVLMLRPFFESPYGSYFEKDATRAHYIQSRLGSSYASMAFIPPLYCRHNGLRTKSEEKRESLFRVAFCSLLHASFQSNPGAFDAITEVLKFLLNKVWTEESENEAKAVGLLRTKPEDTSIALKLLASKGLAAPVIKGDGPSLERSLALSLVRQSECAGFTCRTYTLQGAWPPPWTKKPENAAGIPTMNTLAAHTKDLRVIKSFLSGHPNRAIVLIQGVPNAQGPDVMVLRPSIIEEREPAALDSSVSLDSLNDSVSEEDVGVSPISETFVLDIYQVKNLSGSKTVDEMTRTLGVVQSNTELVDDITPTTESEFSAKYSAQAIQLFCAELGVSVGDRVVVKPNGANIQQGHVKVWTRAHLEPCFSIFEGQVNT